MSLMKTFFPAFRWLKNFRVAGSFFISTWKLFLKSDGGGGIRVIGLFWVNSKYAISTSSAIHRFLGSWRKSTIALVAGNSPLLGSDQLTQTSSTSTVGMITLKVEDISLRHWFRRSASSISQTFWSNDLSITIRLLAISSVYSWMMGSFAVRCLKIFHPNLRPLWRHLKHFPSHDKS